MIDHAGSRDSGSSYFARDGKVFVRRGRGMAEECGTALTANGRELERFELALDAARAQRRKRRSA
jgi:hypothetical protein